MFETTHCKHCGSPRLHRYPYKFAAFVASILLLIIPVIGWAIAFVFLVSIPVSVFVKLEVLVCRTCRKSMASTEKQRKSLANARMQSEG